MLVNVLHLEFHVFNQHFVDSFISIIGSCLSGSLTIKLKDQIHIDYLKREMTLRAVHASISIYTST